MTSRRVIAFSPRVPGEVARKLCSAASTTTKVRLCRPGHSESWSERVGRCPYGYGGRPAWRSSKSCISHIDRRDVIDEKKTAPVRSSSPLIEDSNSSFGVRIPSLMSCAGT